MILKNLKRLALFALILLTLHQIADPVTQAQVNIDRLNEGLVGYWTFDEGSGRILFDRSPFDNDGELDGPSWVNGLIEFGLNFYGRETFIAKVKDTNSLDVNNTLTLTCWICLNKNLVEDSEDEEFFAFAKPNIDVYGLGIEHEEMKAQGHLNIAGEPQTILSETSVPQSRWFHLSLSYDAETGETKLYLDGQVDQTVTLGPGPIEINDDLLYLGSALNPETNTPGMGVLPGILDEARIYNRVLLPEEVAQLATEAILLPNLSCGNCFSSRSLVDYINTLIPRQLLTHEEFLRLLFVLSNGSMDLPSNATIDEIVAFFVSEGVIPQDYPVVADDPISKGAASLFMLRALNVEMPLLDQILITMSIKRAEEAAFEIAVREKLISAGSADEFVDGLDVPDLSFLVLNRLISSPPQGFDPAAMACASGKFDKLTYFFVPPTDIPVPGS